MDKQPEVTEEFDTGIGVITAELYTEGVIKFYREEEDEPYRTENFKSYEDADNEFFSLDSQIIDKFYLPETEKIFTVETVCFHQVKAESTREALEIVTSMESEDFIGEMISPESQVVEVEEE